MATSSKKVLIIEDEKPMAHALELKLQHEGFEAEAILNPEEGALLLQNESYSLLLLDLIMPKLDGFKVLEMLKAKKIKIPVIVLSNLSQEDDESRAKALGAKDFFVKSNVPIATIVERVKEYLKE